MRYASDFRRIARNALRGKWALAVLVGLVVMLLGGVSANGPEFKLTFENQHANFGIYYGEQTIYSTQGGILPAAVGILAGGIAIITLIVSIVRFILGSVIGIGYARFNLELVNNSGPHVESLLRYFPNWSTAICTNLLAAFRIFLWSLLFVIPGIVASFSYAMTDYILAETPNISASEAINISKMLMKGNRWRLFCLRFSFIGWDLLTALTFGIGNIFLTPYKQAAEAAFYMDIVKSSYAPYDI